MKGPPARHEEAKEQLPAVEGVITNAADLEPGDRVVYPNQGVCRITGIETKEIAGQRLELVRMEREEASRERGGHRARDRDGVGRDAQSDAGALDWTPQPHPPLHEPLPGSGHLPRLDVRRAWPAERDAAAEEEEQGGDEESAQPDER